MTSNRIHEGKEFLRLCITSIYGHLDSIIQLILQ